MDAAMVQIQREFANTREQMSRLAQQHDSLRHEHDLLKATSDQLFRVRQDEIRASEDKLQKLLFGQKFDLLDLKALQPENFKGRRTDAFKPWARKLKAYCNAKRQGFRKALEWAENQQQEITDLSGMAWDHAIAADAKLHDFLLMVLQEDAQILVDTPALETRGFEAWRLLVKRYAPSGGQYELDAMMALMSLTAVRDVAALPGAISKFERDLALYERRSGRAFPEEFKIPAFLKLLPKGYERDLKQKFAEGLTDYRKLTEQILTYSQHIRFEGAFGRGDNDMDIGSLDWASLAAEEIVAFYEGVT